MKLLVKLISLIAVLGCTSVYAGSRAPIEMAITVDDLPGNGDLSKGSSRVEVIKKMISTFKNHHIPEVYGFVNGEKVSIGSESDLEALKVWVDAGYPLGNHTYSHPHLNDLSVEEYTSDIAKNEKVLQELNGKMDWHYFRYPFLNEGETFFKRNGVRNYLSQNNYKIANVTISFRDWAWNAPYLRCLKQHDRGSIRYLKNSYIDNAMEQLDRAKTLSKGLFQRQVKEILVIHLSDFSVEMLDNLLMKYEKAGVKWVTLAEASSDPVFELNPNFISNSGFAFLYEFLQSKEKRLEDYDLDPVTQFPENDLIQTCMEDY